MKTIKIILLSIIVSYNALCQTMSHSKSGKVEIPYTAISLSHPNYVETEQKVSLLTAEGYKFSPGFGVKVINNDGSPGTFFYGRSWGSIESSSSLMIPNHAQVEICTALIDEKNANNFLYHIVQNDERELVPWSKPTVFKTLGNGIKYCYLGKFNYSPLQLLKVEVYNKNDHFNKYFVLLDWRVVQKPSFFGAIQYVSAIHPPASGWSLRERRIYDTIKTKEPHYQYKTKKTTWVPYNDFLATELSPNNDISHAKVKFRLGDSLQNIRFVNFSDMDFRSNGTYERNYDFKVSLARKIGIHSDTINIGEVTGEFDLNKEFWKYPGKYILTIVPDLTSPNRSQVTVPRELIQTISFTVLPPLNIEHKVPLSSVIIAAAILLTVIGSAFFIYHQLQKRKLITEAQNKQIVTLQLQSVRSQLNPHFIFNALAGVQNLINKNAIDDANKYLARFARLTRNILDDGRQELTTIEHELEMLTDYLQMEQMRFGFKFNIEIERGIDQQIEIPGMLLQPFIENAVKHGVSALKNDGMITLNIIKKADDIILVIKDNGKGFSTKQPAGMGIKLCEERIKLLQSIYKNNVILLHINSDSKGTLITIELKNLL